MTTAILPDAGWPLKVREIAMNEHDYRADNVPNMLSRAIRDTFKRERGRFERQRDGRWAVVH